MVYLPKCSFIANRDSPTSVSLSLGEMICFGSLEFTANWFDRLCLSLEGDDSGAIFVGMMHNGSPCLHTILKESSDEGGTTSGEGGSSGFPAPHGCNMVTPTVPITTAPPPENTLAFLTIPTVTVQTTAPQPGMEPLLEQQHAYQVEQ
jgi:hypothetical protein